MKFQFLICSIFAHVFFVLAVSLTQSIQMPPQNLPIEIKWAIESKSAGVQRKKSQGSVGKKKALALFPSYKDHLFQQVTSNSAVTESGAQEVPDFAKEYQSMDMAQIRFIKSLWHEIDQSIVESQYLSEYGHVGKVALSFEISPEGHLVESHFRAQAEDPILKVVAARAVRRALQNKNQNLVLPKTFTQVEAQFAWASYEACSSLKGTQRNFLSFCKYGENKQKNFTNGEKALTYMNAIKYGPGMFEEIKKYKRQQDHRKTQFDPFEEMRRDRDYNLGT